MSRVLFVSNGHGEVAISDRISAELRSLAPQIEIEHLGLVGDIPARFASEVGPRARMPSGGLIAMGNVANILRDLRAGLLRLTVRQWQYLRRTADRYDAVVAVGDTFALWMALQTRRPVAYVGTAKSVYVAPYGRLEERILRRAREAFVRDEPTADRLRSHGIAAEAPGNVIADLFGNPERLRPELTEGFTSAVALLPGSRAHAYEDAVFLTRIFSAVARDRAGLGAMLSIAPGIDAERIAGALRDAGCELRSRAERDIPFEVMHGSRVLVRAWGGEIAAVLHAALLVLGQAGTANEAAAAAGRAVLAFDRGVDKEHASYRWRQSRLLGDALVIASSDLSTATRAVSELLDSPQRLARLGAIGRERMGRAGGARRIAERIAELVSRADTPCAS